MSLCGPADMNWEFIFNQFPYFKQYKTKYGSRVITYSARNIYKFMNYLYPNGYDNIGLRRKWDKYLVILEDIQNTSPRLLSNI